MIRVELSFDTPEEFKAFYKLAGWPLQAQFESISLEAKDKQIHELTERNIELERNNEVLSKQNNGLRTRVKAETHSQNTFTKYLDNLSKSLSKHRF